MRRSRSAVVAPIALVVLVGLVASTAASARDWRPALDDLLAAPAGADVAALVDEVVKAGPDWRDVAVRIEGLEFPDLTERGVPVLRTVTVADTLTLPWVLVLPADYDPRVPTPLLVVLHGGVSRAHPEEDPVAYVTDDPFAAMAAREGWISLSPFGQVGATWWDKAGMANVRSLVRAVKRECNVDDDRVWLAGFSDGASAAFLNAMVSPNDYAAFVALNGHMGVGSLDGNLPTYAPNLSNTPVYARHDLRRSAVSLAHSADGRSTWRAEAGGQILYRELPGVHDFDYADEELPRIAAFLESPPARPVPVADRVGDGPGRSTGRAAGSRSTGVTTAEPEAWHGDFNVALPDETVTIGFLPDDTYEGEGVLVGGSARGRLRRARHAACRRRCHRRRGRPPREDHG